MNPPDEAAPEPGAAKPFLDHLEELRHALIRSGVALFLGVCIAFPLAPKLLGILKRPLHGIVENPDAFMQSVEITGAFSSAIRIAMWGGLLLSAPFIVYFMGSFIAPGLTGQEKRVVLRSAGFAIGLFFLGVALGYFVTLPVALEVMFGLHDWLGIQAIPRINSYVAFSIQLLIGFGLAFQLPVVVLILGRLGIVNAQKLRSSRSYVIVFLLVLAMALTPPDIFTQLLMAIPLILLYELCIWILSTKERKKADIEETP